jgi:hypothetical protein
MTTIRFEEYLTTQLCKNNPNALIVFGDNLIGKGKRGQAIIRDEPNAFGIPTKRLPSMDFNAFFSDKPEEIRIVKDKINTLLTSEKDIILPLHKIGSGLAKLREKSPQIAKLIDELYSLN